MECYLLSKSKVRGYRKHMLSLWLNDGIFWVSKEKLVDQANIIHRNSLITVLEIEDLERNLAENDGSKEGKRSADYTGSNLGEEVRNILTALEADEEIGNLEEEVMSLLKKWQRY